MAVETPAFLTAKVPPKPQHWSLLRQLDQRRGPRTALKQTRCGLSPRCSDRSEWQEVWSVTVMRIGGADVGDAELVDEQLA